MTRRLLIAAGLGALLGGAAPSAEAQASPKALSPQVQAELIQVRQAVWLAWFKGDRRALADLLSDDLVAINADAEAWEHKGDALHSGESFAADGGELVHLEFPTTEFQVYGDIAVLYSTYAVEFRQRGQTFTQSGRSTEVFHRVKKRWVNTGWHLDLGPPSAK